MAHRHLARSSASVNRHNSIDFSLGDLPVYTSDLIGPFLLFITLTNIYLLGFQEYKDLRGHREAKVSKVMLSFCNIISLGAYSKTSDFALNNLCKSAVALLKLPEKQLYKTL